MKIRSVHDIDAEIDEWKKISPNCTKGEDWSKEDELFWSEKLVSVNSVAKFLVESDRKKATILKAELLQELRISIKDVESLIKKDDHKRGIDDE